MKITLPMTALSCALACVPLIGHAQAGGPLTDKPLSLSLGTVKDQLESSAVRALVKFANDGELQGSLINPNQASFYLVRRKIDFDVTDKGALGGAALRYGVVRISPTQEDVVLPGGVIVTQSAGLIHTIPVSLGLDADRSFKNRDVLLEVGYVPFKGGPDPSCFKLGGNPIVGVVGQLGHRQREVTPADFKTSLQRVKLEFKTAFTIGPCFGAKAADRATSADALGALASDIGTWRVMLDAYAWRDFVDKKSYHYAGLTIRIPSGKDAFVDFKREVGAMAPSFAKASQYGAYLTVQY